MAELTPEIVDAVLAACTEGAEEAAEAFGRALDVQIAVSVGQPGAVEMEKLPEGLEGPGLAVVLTVGTAGALVLLPESTGLVPPWCRDPDPTGQSKLTTLAQELGMIVLPEDLLPGQTQAARVENLAEALRRGGVSGGASVVPLELTADEKQGVASVIWPASEPAGVLESTAAEPEPPAKPEPAVPPKPAAKPEPSAPPKPGLAPKPGPAPQAAASSKATPNAGPNRRTTRLTELPEYTQSLLRIKVPVVVTLADKRQPLGRVVELGAGSIIQFDKSCEEMLQLSVGGHPVATGEAVKVGDKFGLRITSMILPDERFRAVRPE